MNPVQLKPLLEVLDSTDVVLNETPLWKKFVEPLVSKDYVQQAVGWKAQSELINGRVAMIGYVTADKGWPPPYSFVNSFQSYVGVSDAKKKNRFVGVFLGELGGGGSFLKQLSSSPREILILQAILTGW